MIAEIPQPITCFISTKSEILSDYAAPRARPRLPACARPSRATSATAISGQATLMPGASGGATALGTVDARPIPGLAP
jgi:hypothetical protein